MFQQILRMLPVYVPPVVLAAACLIWIWRRDVESPTALEVGVALVVPLIIAFCALEQRWPWELRAPWRAHYWIPLGLVLVGSGTLLLDRFAGKRCWLLAAGPLFGTLALYGLLSRYASQFRPEWSDSQHGWLLLALLLGAWGHQLGHMGLSRRFPASGYLLMLNTLLIGGAAFGFFGASSLKVAQWMTLGGAIAGTSLLISFFFRSRRLSAAFGLVCGHYFAAVLLYGLYAAEEAALSPAILLLGATWSGIPLAFRDRSSALSWRAVIGHLVWIALVTGMAFALSLQHRSGQDSPEEENDMYDLDAYGWVAPSPSSRI